MQRPINHIPKEEDTPPSSTTIAKHENIKSCALNIENQLIYQNFDTQNDKPVEKTHLFKKEIKWHTDDTSDP